MSPADMPGHGTGGGPVESVDVVIGLVASPGPATDLANELLPDLSRRITGRLPGARWDVRLVSDRLVERPADLTELISAARRRLLSDGWQLVVCLTDLPLQTARRPVVAHASASHGVAVLSLPALGAVAVSRRACEGIVRLVAALVGAADGDQAGGAAPTRRRVAVSRRIQELGDQVHHDEHGIGFVAGVVTGNLRLLLGMLRANRPWRLAVRLSRALVAALTAAVFALVTSDIWRLGDSLGAVRLSLLTVASVVAVVLTIVIGADLWEHAPSRPTAPTQVVLFNVVTLTTVVLGVLALYLSLLLLTMVGTLLLVPSGLLVGALGHPIGFADQVEVAWLAASVATVGGALGAGLETDEAVREAAYRYQPDDELSGT